MDIIKASGEREPFSSDKLRYSLELAGASPFSIEKVIGYITKEIKDGTETSLIYRHAFNILRKFERPAAARYSLKKAIMELGPSGHPFEKLVGKLLLADGFSVEVGKIVQGACVSHEIDVVAQKDNRHIMVECKFHNQQGIKSDVKIALYVQARFEDVQRAWQRQQGHAQKFHEAWLVTNTKLTSEAIQYAQCVSIKAIGWHYPAQESLEARIDRAGIHPITCLTTLSRFQKQQLLAGGIVICKEILEDENILRFIGLPKLKASGVIDEIKQFCHPL